MSRSLSKCLLGFTAVMMATINVLVSSQTCEATKRLRIALVRHGESMNNVHEAVSEANYVAHRQADPDLSERGFLQAEALGAFLANTTASSLLRIHPVHKLMVSPVKRALQTMAPTAKALGLRPLVRTNFFEAGGVYNADSTYSSFVAQGGMTRSEMMAAFSQYDLPDDITEEGWYTGVGKETDDECRERATGIATELKMLAGKLRESKQVVFVAHYDFMCSLLDALVIPGVEHSGAFLNWQHYNTGITVIDITAKGKVKVLMANAVPHLTREETTPLNLISGLSADDV